MHSVGIAGTLITPIHRLPEDVLVEIFSAYLAVSPPLGEHRSPLPFSFVSYQLAHGGLRVHCPTLRLSHICSFWRKVTFSRPSLWASLSLDLGRLDLGPLSLLSYYLSRSSQLPLNLDLCMYGEGDAQNQEQALDMLIGHSTRWQSVTLNNAYHSMWDPFFSMLDHFCQPFNLPHLKDLRLRLSGRPGIDHFIQFIAHAPNLEILDGGLFGRYLELSWKEFCECGFNKLKEIHNVRLRGASIGQFLAQTPVLEEFELASSSNFSADIQDPYHISSLTTLSINLTDCPAETWRTLRTPSLTSLELTSLEFFSPELTPLELRELTAIGSNVAEISSMLLQSGCVLQRVSLKHGVLVHAACLLRSHPSVEKLTLCQGGMIRDLFASLTISEGDVPLAPNLRYLEIENPQELSHTGLIGDIVRSRVDEERVLPLQKVVMKSTCSYLEWHEIKEFRSAGERIRSSLAPFVASGLRFSLVEPSNWSRYESEDESDSYESSDVDGGGGDNTSDSEDAGVGAE